MAELKIKDLDDSVRGGFSVHERQRLENAYWNLRFSQACFDEYEQGGAGSVVETSGDTWDHTRPKMGGSTPGYEKAPNYRSSPIFKRIMDVLTQNLYKAPVGRHLATPEATDWLNRVYQANAMGAKWQRADQLTMIGGFSTFQFAGNDDPKSPIKIHLWGPEQCVVFCDPDDQTQAGAVAVIDMYDGQRRLALWTKQEVRYYRTKKGGPYPADGGTSWELSDSKPNPYKDRDGEGILPFSFAHWNFPAQEFEQHCPGDNIRELNDAVNFGLNDLGDGIRYLAKPIGLATGVDEGWSPPTLIKPGMFLNLPASSIDAAGNGPVPDLKYVNPELGFVSTIWEDLNNYIDHSLEMHGVPPSTIRMTLNAQSGVAILAEQSPLLSWAEGRRRPFGVYEERTAGKALAVGAAHLRNHKIDAGELEEVAADPRLALTWPRMYVQLPGPDRRLEDDHRINRGYASKIMILMESEDLSEDQAFERFKRVKEHNDKLAAMGIEPTAYDTPPAPPSPFGDPNQLPPGDINNPLDGGPG